MNSRKSVKRRPPRALVLCLAVACFIWIFWTLFLSGGEYQRYPVSVAFLTCLAGLAGWTLGKLEYETLFTRPIKRLSDAINKNEPFDYSGNIAELKTLSDQVNNLLLTQAQAANVSDMNRQQYAETMDLLLKTFQALPIGVALIGENTKIRFANSIAARMFGVNSADELRDRSCRDFLCFNNAASCLASISKRPEADFTPDTMNESELRQANGETLRVARRAMTITLGGEKVVLETLVDITRPKELEERLEHTRQLAIKAARFHSDFIAGVSHELRTPLNAILGFSAILRDKLSGRDEKEQAEIILREAEILLAVTDRLLDGSAKSVESTEPDCVPFDLSQTAASALMSTRQSAAAANAPTEIYYDPTAPQYVQGDPLRTRIALSGLLEYAIAVADNHEILLSVKTLKPVSDQEARLRFSVTLSNVSAFGHPGAGISASGLKAARKSLELAEKCLKALNSSIHKDTSHGHWFDLSLPVVTNLVAKEDSKDAVTNEPDENSIPALKPQNCIILSVEDYPPNQYLVKSLLENLGYQCQLAANGSEAIERCERTRFNLILMDLRMPDMPGDEVTKLIRAGHSPNRDTPILALTAEAEGAISRRCHDAGMNDLLVKPLRRDLLAQALEKWINHERSIISESPKANAEQQDKDTDKPANATARTSTRDVETRDNDFNSALEEFGGDLAILSMALEHFVLSASDSANQIRDLTQQGDLEAAANEAHKLRGAAANLRGDALARVLGQIENGLRTDGADHITPLFDSMDRDLEAFVNAANQFLNTMTQS